MRVSLVLGRRLLSSKSFKKAASYEDFVEITEPLTIDRKRARKDRQREGIQQRLVAIRQPKNLLISTKRRALNYYVGQQAIKKHDPNQGNWLASGGWKNNKSKGREFLIRPIDKNPAFQRSSSKSGRLSFRDLGCSEQMDVALRKLAHPIKNPSEIQLLAIPSILAGDSCLLSAETGSGKTLAYLVPLLEKLLRSPVDENGCAQQQMIVILPSRELVRQVYAIADRLIQLLSENDGCPKLMARCLLAKESLVTAHELQTTNLLVGTPGVIANKVSRFGGEALRPSWLVLDEVDSLLDDSFVSLVAKIMNRLHADERLVVSDQVGDVNPLLNVVLVGATVPADMKRTIGQFYPLDSLIRLETPKLHKKFIRTGQADKPERFLKIARAAVQNKLPLMVFCNGTSTAIYLERLLSENGIDHCCLHKRVGPLARDVEMEQFGLNSAGQQLMSFDCSLSSMVMVATDILSRGIDSVGVHQVLNYEFPQFLSDYIHRSGRVGRLGSKWPGLVTSFVSRVWEVDRVWEIERAVRYANGLLDLDANIKRALKRRKETVK